MDVIITPTRVVVMTILTYGLYLFYWFYVTWKHYRDHTGQEAYPVWHALALSIPIYGLFRTHAHVRTYRELMATAGITTTLSASLAVVLTLISNVLDWSSFPTLFGGEITRDLSTFTTTINLISIAIVAGLILHIQGNLNSYWIHVRDSTSGVISITSARIGVGEVVFGIIGVLSWLNTISVLSG